MPHFQNNFPIARRRLSLSLFTLQLCTCFDFLKWRGKGEQWRMLGLPGYLLKYLMILFLNFYLALIIATKHLWNGVNGYKFSTCFPLFLKFLVTWKADFLLITGWFLGGLSVIWLVCDWFVAGLWVVSSFRANENFVGVVMDRSWLVMTILRRPRVTHFGDIIKIVAIFIKTFLKDSRKIKTIRNYIPKCNICIFLDVAKFADLQQRKCLWQQNSRGVSRDSYIFWIFFS